MRLPQGPRWLGLALLLSLGGNAFLGGYMFGRGDAAPPFGFPAGPPPGGFPPGPPPRPEHFIARLAERLPAPDAALVRAFLEENRRSFDADDARRREFPHRMRAAMRADPFDAAAFEQVFAEHDEAEYQTHRRLRGELAKVAAFLSPEARRILADFGPPGPPPPRP